MENLNTVSITDFRMLGKSKTVAKVVISYTGKFTKESLQASIADKFGGKAAPIENSFRAIRKGVSVGFIRANLDIRVPTQKDLKASYRVMGSGNIMMDNRDKSLWQVKKGSAGTYLARHVQEDLSELVEATVHPRSDVPSLGSMVSASAARREFASYVNDMGDVDYGFVTAVSRDGSKMKVLSTTTRIEHVVDADATVGLYQVGIPKRVHAHILKAGIDPSQKAHEKEYFEKLYFYAPEFLNEVKQNIDEGTDC